MMHSLTAIVLDVLRRLLVMDDLCVEYLWLNWLSVVDGLYVDWLLVSIVLLDVVLVILWVMHLELISFSSDINTLLSYKNNII